MTTASRPLAIFGLLSLATVALGVFITVSHGATLAPGLRNLAAWSVGALLAAGLVRVRWAGLPVWALWLSPLILLITLFSADMQGVHRWIDLGPLHLNAAMLVLPSAVAALAGLAGKGLWPWGPALACGAILVAQPDASQVTSLAMAAVAIAMGGQRSFALRAAVILMGLALTAVAWTRPDPLAPVPEVEGIIGLALALAPPLGVAACGLLLALVIWPLIALRAASTDIRLGAAALCALLAGWGATPFFGAFPVPILGLGMSPIIGAWLGVGLLARKARLEAAQARP